MCQRHPCHPVIKPYNLQMATSRILLSAQLPRDRNNDIAGSPEGDVLAACRVHQSLRNAVQRAGTRLNDKRLDGLAHFSCQLDPAEVRTVYRAPVAMLHRVRIHARLPTTFDQRRARQCATVYVGLTKMYVSITATMPRGNTRSSGSINDVCNSEGTVGISDRGQPCLF